jgi:hypothetical protein
MAETIFVVVETCDDRVVGVSAWKTIDDANSTKRLCLGENEGNSGYEVEVFMTKLGD